jgi:uncharacterized protein YllA (UPF0747 family)
MCNTCGTCGVAVHQGTWTDDELVTALENLEESLRSSVKDASTFDKYRKEVLSGTLEWSSMHTDSSFWRENIIKFEQQNYQVRCFIAVPYMSASYMPNTCLIHAFYMPASQ